MPEVSITLPIYWQQTKKKLTLLSLNNYRNWHYHTSNKFKQVFTDKVIAQITPGECIEGQYTTHSIVYYKRANCDASNIVPVVEKVLLDALITAGVLQGDSVKFHTGASWEVRKDSENPRCVTTITKIENKDD